MSSMFSESGSSGQSAEAELAALAKESPELTEGREPAVEEVAEQPQEPAQAADEGVQPEGQGSGEPPADKPRGIPPAAVAEERERRRAAEARAQMVEQQLAQMQGQLEAMQRLFQQPQQPQAQQQEQPPDPNEDPIGALNYERQQREAIQQRLENMMLTQRIEADTAMATHAFSQQNPDYPQAAQYLVNQRFQELKVQAGGRATDQQIMAHVVQEARQLSLQALQERKNPAEVFYSLAHARGYQKPAAAPAKAAAVDPALAEAKRRAATGISEGGSHAKGELSLEDIANLKGAAQESALAKWEAKNVKRSSLFRN